jgi:lipoprotein-anchoring transpeptidase ErfK/SrfK
VGIGKEGHATPQGRFQVGDKISNPPWMPIGKDQLPFGHPENPLGTRWIAWFREGVKTSYGFHGTWEPEGVGGRVSQGCIRMRNEDVESLFELLPMGADILVVP